MRIVENSHNYLILSNAGSFWGKWGFVAATITVLLGGVFIAVKVIHPPCWSGFAIICMILFLVLRELPRSFDTEFWFDRENEQVKLIKHPWLGRQQVEQYSLQDITEVRLVEMKHPRNYPGHDYIEDDNKPIEPPVYEVELGMQSGNRLIIYGAAHLAGQIAEFLGITLIPPS